MPVLKIKKEAFSPMGASRKNHLAAFKAKAALEAIKKEKTLAQLAGELRPKGDIMKKTALLFVFALILRSFITGNVSASDRPETISVQDGRPFIIQINGKGEKSVYYPKSGQKAPEPDIIHSDSYRADILQILW